MIWDVIFSWNLFSIAVRPIRTSRHVFFLLEFVQQQQTRFFVEGLMPSSTFFFPARTLVRVLDDLEAPPKMSGADIYILYGTGGEIGPRAIFFFLLGNTGTRSHGNPVTRGHGTVTRHRDTAP